MYCPFLRGKQYELIALREFAIAHPECENVLPIIEPVRLSNSGIVKAAKVMSINRMHYAIVLNPQQGDFAIDDNSLDIGALLSELDGNNIKPILALLVGDDVYSILNMVSQDFMSNVMLIYQDSIDIDKNQMLINHEKVEYIVAADVDSRSNCRSLLQTQKKIIRLDDRFIIRRPNVAYRGVEEDRYTEEFYYYKNDRFYGFSDYCVLPKLFSEGGGTPTAIALHLTYQKKQDSIWVRHFVSDEEFDSANIRNKYFSILQKVKTFFEDKTVTPAVNELLTDCIQFPGLGVLKKITIRNHIELVSNLI